jgi:hypothetical protein
MSVHSALQDRTPSKESLLNLITSAGKIKKKSLVYKHSGEIPNCDPPDRTVDVDIATESLIDRVITSEKRRKKFRQFLHDWHVGFIAHDEESFIARGWVCTPLSMSVPYNLPAWVADLDAYWLTHARTKEGYRNQGWHKYMISRRLQWIQERAQDGPVYTETGPENVSRYTFASTGFEPCGVMTTYRLGHPTIGVKQFGNWDSEKEHPPMPHNRNNIEK